MGDGDATRKLLFCPILIDVDRLIVAGRLRKKVDALLGDIDPFPISVPTAALNSLKSLKMPPVLVPAPCQIFISGTLAGMNKSASVTAITSAIVTPGAVS